ncbi:PhzF family phenazine biosynthesis protein [Peribacillus simplex]
MELTIINTFTVQPFKGNPAAVCLLTWESDSEWML